MTFTQAEFDYLASRRLVRLATASPDGVLQNSPTGFSCAPETGTLDIYGRARGRDV
ncbi:hypothetical protein FHR32_005444 [Streptosporangium album]|uniref:Pyridoxamine 5'-phosphate oxidase n=1 Tax=Streptosporangium album TaxID=47479 RepID=A0A7W7WB33_9ACTN|nr:pyridoxamine 5'-phosphate oxidase family protein [Streptosporangium album]MBB4941067.1 hypothetical protein [Streptosporangium album]